MQLKKPWLGMQREVAEWTEKDNALTFRLPFFNSGCVSQALGCVSSKFPVHVLFRDPSVLVEDSKSLTLFERD